MVVFLNGRLVPEAEAVVPVSDRGFLLGDGLFETLRVVNGRPFRLAQHLDRLARGAGVLRITPPFSPRELEAFAGQLVEQNRMPDAVLRVTLTRGPGERGYSPRGAGRPTLVMTLHPAPPREPARAWSLITSSFRIPAGDALASIKTTSKVLHVLARAEAEGRGADEALLLNTNGEVATAAAGNIFWVYQDKLCTVPTGRGVLPGVTRAIVLEICQALGLPAGKRVIKPEALRQSTGLFVAQSVLGLVPVATLDGAPVTPSALSGQIANAYASIVAKECG